MINNDNKEEAIIINNKMYYTYTYKWITNYYNMIYYDRILIIEMQVNNGFLILIYINPVISFFRNELLLEKQ